jgi:hypothetical protein
VDLQKGNAQGEGKTMFNLCDFNLCNLFLEHNYHMNQGIPVFERGYRGFCVTNMTAERSYPAKSVRLVTHCV